MQPVHGVAVAHARWLRSRPPVCAIESEALNDFGESRKSERKR